MREYQYPRVTHHKSMRTTNSQRQPTLSQNPLVGIIYPLPLHRNLQKGLHSGILLTLSGWTYHHRTSVAGPKHHTVNPQPSNLYTHRMDLTPQNSTGRPKTPQSQPPPFQPLSLSYSYFHHVRQKYLLYFHGFFQELFSTKGLRLQIQPSLKNHQ